MPNAMRILWSKSRAVFCVTFNARAILQLETPFLQLLTIHVAVSHLSPERGVFVNRSSLQ